MTRLTRSQVQERNRETVLRVAREAFLRDGYHATSVASVAIEAGFTTGIVYSSFGSKAELAFGVLRELQSEQIASLGVQVDEAASSDDLLARVGAWASEAAGSGWVRLELELLLDTMNDERFAAVQSERQRGAVEQATSLARSMVPREDMDDETVEVLAEAAVDYAIGVGVRRVANSEASPDRLLSLLAPLLAALRR